MVSEYQINEVRELIEGPYRVIYLVKETDGIEVLAVIHSACEGLNVID